MATWVDSVNGYSGNPPFTPDPGIVLDAYDIRVTGSSGATILGKIQTISGGMKTLEAEALQDENQYRIRIGNYRL